MSNLKMKIISIGMIAFLFISTINTYAGHLTTNTLKGMRGITFSIGGVFSSQIVSNDLDSKIRANLKNGGIEVTEKPTPDEYYGHLYLDIYTSYDQLSTQYYYSFRLKLYQLVNLASDSSLSIWAPTWERGTDVSHTNDKDKFTKHVQDYVSQFIDSYWWVNKKK